MDPAATRLLIFIVAYNAETTIANVLSRIPAAVFAYDYEILIVDDQSADRTFEQVEAHRQSHRELNLTVLYNPRNQGYGGNQKIGYEYALQRGFDVVALLHGDGQYAPEMLPALIAPVARGEADAVFGTRMAVAGAALKGGMPLYKYYGNRLLSGLQNRLLGMNLSEFHSGYRVYSAQALAELPFRFNTNDFHFDTEIIIQFHLSGKRILELPIPTYYGNEICRVNGIAYAWNVIRAAVLARLHQMHIFYQRQYDVEPAENRYPLKLGYTSSHTLAIAAVAAGARVLDIGCGRGQVGRELEKKGCTVRGIDDRADGGDCLLNAVVRLDLNRDELPDPAGDYDVVLLLDVLEHLDTPAIIRLLDHIRATAGEKTPTLIITTPNIAYLLIRLQLLRGAFNYGKRGILDLTHRHLFTFRSLCDLLSQSGYRLEEVKGIPPPFPAALGENALSRALLAVNRLLIRLAPGLFSYQIFVRATPLPTVDHLLDHARAEADKRGRPVEKRKVS